MDLRCDLHHRSAGLLEYGKQGTHYAEAEARDQLEHDHRDETGVCSSFEEVDQLQL